MTWGILYGTDTIFSLPFRSVLANFWSHLIGKVVHSVLDNWENRVKMSLGHPSGNIE